MKKLKDLPKFRNEDEEAEFWNTHDSTEYIDWSKAKKISFPNLKPTTTPISIRIPNFTIVRLKEKANAMNIPYQALIKQYIEKGLIENL